MKHIKLGIQMFGIFIIVFAGIFFVPITSTNYQKAEFIESMLALRETNEISFLNKYADYNNFVMKNDIVYDYHDSVSNYNINISSYYISSTASNSVGMDGLLLYIDQFENNQVSYNDLIVDVVYEKEIIYNEKRTNRVEYNLKPEQHVPIVLISNYHYNEEIIKIVNIDIYFDTKENLVFSFNNQNALVNLGKDALGTDLINNSVAKLIENDKTNIPTEKEKSDYNLHHEVTSFNIFAPSFKLGFFVVGSYVLIALVLLFFIYVLPLILKRKKDLKNL